MSFDMSHVTNKLHNTQVHAIIKLLHSSMAIKKIAKWLF
jgi:hypothetical protein